MGSSHVLEALTLPSGPSVLDSRTELSGMLEGGRTYLPVPYDVVAAQRLGSALGVGEPISDELTLVISTSGSTGTPKGAQHTSTTLQASAAATASHLGGPGNWLLALPPHHIAGLQVLLRSLAAGHTPVVLDVGSGFDVSAYVEAVEALDGPRRYTSLVPTQLIKVLSSPAAVAASCELDAILVGGAATPEALQRRAFDSGLPIVRTYGMSETAGGCVYNGVPLPGVEVRIVDAGSDGVGRVEVAGPMVAHGYRNLPDHPAFASPGWFRTDDVGVVADGVLRIVGRADEAISTGGLTVVPQVVEAVIADDPAVAECAVVGVPDEQLGEKVVAFVVLAPGERLDDKRIRASVVERLEKFAAPREIVEVTKLPLRGPGKVDRAALKAQYE